MEQLLIWGSEIRTLALSERKQVKISRWKNQPKIYKSRGPRFGPLLWVNEKKI